jgi:hypothetical protein
VTKVTAGLAFISLLALVLCDSVGAQAGPEDHDAFSRSIQDLYAQLQQVGLDEKRVYRVRNVSFDRAAFHISLEDGTLGFTRDVLGKVTGAFFKGDGEVLLLPPNQVERASMALFTGAAILEEHFSSAYFRFNDNTYEEFRAAVAPADDAQQFVAEFDQTVKSLAGADALRLLLSLSRRLPAGNLAASPPGNLDRMLHARIQGDKLGNFDLYYDSGITEQIWAGQLKTEDSGTYYNVWTSFAAAQRPARSATGEGPGDEFGPANILKFLDYKIQASVIPPRQLSAEAFVNVQVQAGGERAVLFELSRFLRVKNVTCNGQPVAFIHNPALEGTQLSRRGNDLLLVVFPVPLRLGEKLALHFSYEGDVLSEAGGGLLYVGARGTWYPNRGSETAHFDLQFRYPPGWTLVGTGKPAPPTGTAPADPDMQVSRWISDKAIPLAGFNLGKYSRSEAHAGQTLIATYATAGVERTFPKGTEQTSLAPAPLRPPFGRTPDTAVTVVAPPPSPARNAQTVADEAARAVEFFSKLYGPYPYSQLSLTQMPGDLSQGWPSLVFLSSFSFLTPEDKSHLHLSDLDKTLSSAVVSHEIAHQWWGDLVSWKSYRDQWLVEALANYSSLMLLESHDPARFAAIMQRFRENLLAKNKQEREIAQAGPVSLGVRLSNSEFPEGYEMISYGRGTWLLHMLRTMMRDAQPAAARPGSLFQEPFIRALMSLRKQYEGRAMTARDMLKAFEAELPRSAWHNGKSSLDWFYEGWINGASVPKLELQKLKYAEESGRVLITGMIVQKEADKYLITSVPIYTNAKERPVLLGRVFADGEETTFQLTAPRGTRGVALDPYQAVLKRR